MAHPGPIAAAAAPEGREVTGARVRRLAGSVVALAALGLLLVAAWLEPSPTGVGTHAQLRLPSCGWIALMDLPCPTCGMTTAFAHAADGHLLSAVGVQPLGAALALATAIALIVGAYVAVTGSRVGVLFGGLWGRRGAWALGVFAAGAWTYKILTYKGVL